MKNKKTFISINNTDSLAQTSQRTNITMSQLIPRKYNEKVWLGVGGATGCKAP
jgi:hypothetical protein